MLLLIARGSEEMILGISWVFDHNLPAGRSQTPLDFSFVPLPLGADQSGGYKSSIFAASPGLLKAVMNQKESLAGFKEPFANYPPFISLCR